MFIKGYVMSEEHKRKISIANSGCNNGMYGKKHSKEFIEKRVCKLRGRKRVFTEEWKERIGEATKKRLVNPQNHPMWKGGSSKLCSKIAKQKYKSLKRGGGPLTKHTIQLVYEDNIKKYGTLTCYICTIPIEFGNDALEHRIPLSRGGTNDYSNLSISCRRCNHLKHNHTVEEYFNKIGK